MTETLIRMQLSYLDLFFAHRPDKIHHQKRQFGAMNQLIHSGKNIVLGTSEWMQEIIERETHMVANKTICKDHYGTTAIQYAHKNQSRT